MLLGWGRGGGGTDSGSGVVSAAFASAFDAIDASGAGLCFLGLGRVGPPIFSSRRGAGLEAGPAASVLARARTVSAPGRESAFSDRGLPSDRFCDASLRARRVGLATGRR